MEPTIHPRPDVTRAARPAQVLLLAAVVAVVLAGLVATPASAHGGIVPQPVVTQLPDGLPGLEARGLVQYAPRIRVTNPNAEQLVVVDDSGTPWLQISAEGVYADFSVRDWYESLDSSGRGEDPDPSIESSWTKVSDLPTWEWFDTVLLPREGEEGHEWSIPVVVDGRFDELRGVLRESDLEGQWNADLRSDGSAGEAQLTVISGPVPVFIVQLLDAEEVVVIGRHDEPVLRLTARGFEVNRASPTWNDHARLDPGTSVGDVVEDPEAEPVWEMQVAEAPTATWLDVRAASEDVVPQSRSATTITAEIPVIVDGVRHDVPVQTAWIGDEVPLVRLTVPGLIAASLGAGLLAAGAVRLWERRRAGAGDDGDVDAPDADDGGDGDGDGDDPVETDDPVPSEA